MHKGIIGIVGGMEPNAGIALSKNIINQTIVKNDQSHLPQILYSVPESVPDGTEYILGNENTNPAYRIAKILIELESIGVRFAALACNSAHAPQIFDVILSELNDNYSRIKLLHMIRETGIFIKEQFPGKNKVGILGTK